MNVPRLSEAAWQQRVIDTAQRFGWRVSHSRPALTSRGWRTAIQGDAGAPDLLLARDGVVILAELKSDTGRLTAEQRLWLKAAGDVGALWRPSMWVEVLERLSR